MILSLIIVLGFYISTASDPIYQEPFKVHITFYIDQGVTASGEYVRQGICAAKKEWIGKTAIVYLRKEDGSIGDVYGIYEVLDCGGTKGLQKGNVIDIWSPSLELATQGMAETNGLGYVQILDAEG